MRLYISAWQVLVPQKEDPAEVAFATWRPSDVQSGGAKIATLTGAIGNLPGGQFDIAEVAGLQALVPDAVLEAFPKLALALAKSPPTGLVPNEAAKALLTHFKSVFDRAAAFHDAQAGAGAGGSK